MQKILTGTPDLTDKKIEEIGKLFPNVITEKESEDGKTVKAVDFDLLKQELSKQIVDDDNERYRLDWPGKKRSLLKANTPIDKTLRPVREDSVNFDTTENLYIEGDNFEALKILQESYLGKIKMIYIDPPYNTGTAMIYDNDFSMNDAEYEKELGAISDDGIRMFKNTNTDGKIHSNWLSFMHERLLIARDLLSEDGIICITIDDYEIATLWMLLDEIFGEENRLGTVTIVHNPRGRSDDKFFATSHEYALFYAKDCSKSEIYELPLSEEQLKVYNKTDEISKYRLLPLRRSGSNSTRDKRPNLFFPLYYNEEKKKLFIEKNNINDIEILPIDTQGTERVWRWGKEKIFKNINDLVVKNSNNNFVVYQKDRIKNGRRPMTHWVDSKYDASSHGTMLLKKMFGKNIFSYPKSIYSLLDTLLITLPIDKEALVLDFFSGSATTAHAVMQLNAEDEGNRKFIMIQIPEEIDKSSEAYKEGYSTISEIGKERIRRAAKKIQEDYKDELAKRETPLDTGFRVFRVDSTNMADVKQHPSELKQENLMDLVENIKSDRTSEDLLIEVMLNLGLELSLPIIRKEINYKTVFFVADNSLVACFDQDVDESIIDEIARIKPLKVVLRDASFKDDKDRINFENRFKSLSPETIVSVI